LKKFGDMYFYLSTGAGTWGPPVRIGAPPEIVVFVLETQNGTENKDG
jgi:predicted MPP superfamily phosphohydrolase